MVFPPLTVEPGPVATEPEPPMTAAALTVPDGTSRAYAGESVPMPTGPCVYPMLKPL